MERLSEAELGRLGNPKGFTSKGVSFPFYSSSANTCLVNKKPLPCSFGSECLSVCLPPVCVSASPTLSFSLPGFNETPPRYP